MITGRLLSDILKALGPFGMSVLVTSPCRIIANRFESSLSLL
jgi:hypothetical protein